MNALLNFIADPHNNFIGQSIAYLRICAISIMLAIVIGVVLAVAVSRSPVLSFIAVNLSGLLRAIPVIAFLVAVVPLPFLGIGETPATVALVILGIPPILLNTYTGIRGIDPATIDAAKGMGMTYWQILTRIQAPLTLPVVAAGVRTSAVQVVATATLAAITGAGGYGSYIFDGFNTFNNTAIFAGAIPVAVLALIIEVAMGWLERALTPVGIRREVVQPHMVVKQGELAKA
ncbi:MAG: ABC transporter permease [Ktedonobacteraceae bacterium]|nr:ABC transporter permease [Ktedonobacteraceae bacterium]